MLDLQTKIAEAKAEFYALYHKPIPTSADVDRMGVLGRRLYRLQLVLRKMDA